MDFSPCFCVNLAIKVYVWEPVRVSCCIYVDFHTYSGCLQVFLSLKPSFLLSLWFVRRNISIAGREGYLTQNYSEWGEMSKTVSLCQSSSANIIPHLFVDENIWIMRFFSRNSWLEKMYEQLNSQNRERWKQVFLKCVLYIRNQTTQSGAKWARHSVCAKPLVISRLFGVPYLSSTNPF
jgi:hypothetical protein